MQRPVLASGNWLCSMLVDQLGAILSLHGTVAQELLKCVQKVWQLQVLARGADVSMLSFLQACELVMGAPDVLGQVLLKGLRCEV